MKRVLARVLLCGLLAWSAEVGAHHPGHGGGGGASLFNPFSTVSRPPRTFLDLSFAFDSLDGGLGEVYTYQLSGEYRFHRRFSAGARLPVLSVRQSFFSADGLGDVALVLKGLVAEWPENLLFLSLGTDISFPPGKESEGLGTGDVVFAPFLTASKGFGFLDFFASLGTTVLAGDDPRPSFDFATGVTIPILKNGVGFDFLLAFQGSTTITSEILEAGSTKAYLRPGVSIRPIDPLSLNLGGRISVLDTMEVKPGVVLEPTSPILLSDVEAGFVFDLIYSFH